MKRMISCVLTIVLCLALACPALADTQFVPSISDKGHPDIVGPGTILDGDQVLGDIEGGCLVVTPISEANTSTEIPEDARQTLLDVYEALTNGSMKLPYELVSDKLDPNAMVIRDLFDATFVCEEHSKLIKEEGVTLELTFDLGVDADEEVVVMTYIDGVWAPILSVVNNGDGTVTCLFEDICPIAFAVEGDAASSPSTGDAAGASIWMWTALLVVSVAAMSGLIIANRRKAN